MQDDDRRLAELHAREYWEWMERKIQRMERDVERGKNLRAREQRHYEYSNHGSRAERDREVLLSSQYGPRKDIADPDHQQAIAVPF